MEKGWFERLKQVVQHEVNSGRDMAAIRDATYPKLGQNYVQQMMKKDQPPKPKTLEQLLHAFTREQERFILYGDEPPSEDGTGLALPMADPTAAIVTQVPVVSMVSAGRLKHREGVRPSDIERWMPVANLPKGDWIALIVDGDSMDRVAPDQSAILVNRADSALIDGRYYVFNLDNGETTFKTFRRDPMRLQPYSMNPDHMSIPVASLDDVYVIGRCKIVIQEV